MMKPSQQLTTFQTGFTRVTEEVRACVANPCKIRCLDVGDHCFVTPTTNGQLQTMATSSYASPSSTLEPPLGRNQKPKRGGATHGLLNTKFEHRLDHLKTAANKKSR